MRRNRLGRTDLTVSAVCLGNLGDLRRTEPEAEGHAQLDRALAHGIDRPPPNSIRLRRVRRRRGGPRRSVGSWIMQRGNRAYGRFRHQGPRTFRHELVPATTAVPADPRPDRRGGVQEPEAAGRPITSISIRCIGRSGWSPPSAPIRRSDPIRRSLDETAIEESPRCAPGPRDGNISSLSPSNEMPGAPCAG